MEPGVLVPTEYIMVGVFVLGLLCWGYSKRRSSKTMDEAFLADRKVPGFIASLSTVAANLNVNDFIGMAGEDQTAAASASVKITKPVWKLAFALFVAVSIMYIILTIIF